MKRLFRNKKNALRLLAAICAALTLAVLPLSSCTPSTPGENTESASPKSSAAATADVGDQTPTASVPTVETPTETSASVTEAPTEASTEASTETPTPTPTETPKTPTPTETPTGAALLKNKSALFLGDVLALGQPANGVEKHGYAEIIGETYGTSVKNAAVKNAAVSSAVGKGLISEQIEAEKGRSYDFVILEGGVNDAIKAVDVGRIDPHDAENTDRAALNEETYAGALERLLIQAKEAFPDASVGFVIPGKMTSKSGCVSDMRRFAEIARLACKKYGVHYLDLHDNEAFDAEFLYESGDFVKGDGITPTDAGYQIYAKFIAEFMGEICGVEAAREFSVGPGTVDVKSVLQGKTIVYYGDSICDRSGHDDRSRTPYYSYAGRIRELYEVGNTINRAKSGASLSTVRGTNIIINQTKYDVNKKVDMIVIEGGVNDAWDAAPVGEMSDMTAEDFDVTKLNRRTMAGGLEQVLWYLTTNYPNTVIVYMINFKLNMATGSLMHMENYVEMIKKCCDKWGIVYLDLYNDGWFNARFNIKSTLHSTDGVHPNGPGYDMLAPVLAWFMADSYVAAGPEEFQ